jgi:hypothetical protein
MARFLLIVASAPLLLVGATYPGDKPDPMSDERAYMDEAPVTYRPCRPGPGDDRCIQLYERGVRAAYASWLRDHDVQGERSEVAMGGPMEPVAHHPRRHHDSSADRRRHHDSRADGRRHHDQHADRCLDEDSRDEARGM